LFEDVIAQLVPLAEQKRQSLSLEPIPDGLLLLADRQRLAQALTNLISNAVKFTPAEGHVSVSVVPSNGRAVVSVRDTGPGLQPAEVPYVFEPYWQGRRGSQGVGLGLAIARAIVEAHRGRIWAEGNAGGSEAGSTFAFTMPVAQAPGEGSSVSDAASGIPLRARLGSRP
jgi:signal transduction histidine kinase